MTAGLSTGTNGLALLWLNVLAGTAVGSKTIFAKLHTGDPGAAGATAASGNTTRVSITFASTTTGTISSNNAPTWASWAVGQNGEVISYISLWDASTAGNFLASIQLTAPKTMSTGDTLVLTSGSTTVSLTPIAA